MYLEHLYILMKHTFQMFSHVRAIGTQGEESAAEAWDP